MGKVLHLVVLAALCSATPLQAEELLLDAASGHVVTATVNGVELRLRVVLDAHGVITLNPAAARRAKLGRGDNRSTMVMGPVRVKGRGARRTVMIGGTPQVLPLYWYEMAVEPEVDGVISPALLPYDQVNLRFASPTGEERETTFRVQLSDDDGVHVPLSIGGVHRVAVRFALRAPRTVATGAAAALMAETHGGTLATEPVRVDMGFGVSRPARLLALSSPVQIGSLQIRQMLMRTGDFLGEHALPPNHLSFPNREIVVTAVAKRQDAVYRMTIGMDALGVCSEAEYRRAQRELVIRCR